MGPKPHLFHVEMFDRRDAYTRFLVLTARRKQSTIEQSSNRGTLLQLVFVL